MAQMRAKGWLSCLKKMFARSNLQDERLKSNRLT